MTSRAEPRAIDGEISLDIGELSLRVALAVGRGRTTAVLGPNGAGKTTLLRVVAGLEPLDRGHLRVGDRLLDDGDGVFVQPERRHVAMVPQEHLLFEHMSVLDNVAFGLRCRGGRRVPSRAVAMEHLEAVGLGRFAADRPTVLSGGQSQRAALARALAVRPEVLLLDEPLASLDAAARPEMRAELRRRLADFGGSTLLVTHDPLDAYALADDLIVLESGAATQSGTLQEVTSRPRSRYVAELVGTNLLVGSGSGHSAQIGGSQEVVLAEAVHGEVFVTIAPTAVTLAARHEGDLPPAGSARNHWPATVDSIDRMGERVSVRLSGALPLTAEVTSSSAAELLLRPGSSVWATVKATEVSAYPR